jgi:hypothetical protein
MPAAELELLQQRHTLQVRSPQETAGHGVAWGRDEASGCDCCGRRLGCLRDGGGGRR